MLGQHRRDFVLDSGAISTLAADWDRLRVYYRLAQERYDGGLVIPIPVLTEVISGNRRTDVLVDRLLGLVANNDAAIASLTVENASRAGVLRGVVMRSGHAGISAIDAQVVAIAEERSYGRAITIVTGDPDDIGVLVTATGRTNIGVEVV